MGTLRLSEASRCSDLKDRQVGKLQNKKLQKLASRKMILRKLESDNPPPKWESLQVLNAVVQNLCFNACLCL